MGDFAVTGDREVAQRSVALADRELGEVTGEEGGQGVGRLLGALTRPLVALAGDHLQLVGDATGDRAGGQRLGAAWGDGLVIGTVDDHDGRQLADAGLVGDLAGDDGRQQADGTEPRAVERAEGPPPIWAKPTARPPSE